MIHRVKSFKNIVQHMTIVRIVLSEKNCAAAEIEIVLNRSLTVNSWNRKFISLKQNSLKYENRSQEKMTDLQLN